MSAPYEVEVDSENNWSVLRDGFFVAGADGGKMEPERLAMLLNEAYDAGFNDGR